MKKVFRKSKIAANTNEGSQRGSGHVSEPGADRIVLQVFTQNLCSNWCNRSLLCLLLIFT